MDNIPFSNIVGNEKVKNKLNFYLDNYKNNRYFPAIILSGGRGQGKTRFAHEIGRNLINPETNKPKKFIEVNGIELQKPKHFFENIVIPHMQNEPCLIFVDESHSMGTDASIAFLQILSPNDEHFNTYMYDGVTYDFSLKNHSFVFASSEPNKILDTLLDRLEHIEVSDYKIEELSQMAAKKLKDYKIDKDLLTDIASVCRGNARGLIKISGHISDYIKTQNKYTFDNIDWNNIKKKLSINPMGLSELEIKILKTLKAYPNSSLTKVSSITGLSREAVRLSYEIHLLKNNFMSVQPGSGRALTDAGHKYLEKLVD
jgi:Holliday junction resolvasome RuvABC ATP-dependent DNA helicase subunit